MGGQVISPILLTFSNWCEIPPGGLTFAAVEATGVRPFNLLVFSGQALLFHLIGFSFEPVLIRSIRKLMAGMDYASRPYGNAYISIGNICCGSSAEGVSS